MFQCKAYLNTSLVRITMLVRLLVEVDMVSVFPYFGLENEKKKYSLIFTGGNVVKGN